MKFIKWAIAIVVVAVLATGGYAWWHHAQRYPWTADAYVGAHVMTIAPEIGGRVAELPVSDHAHVVKGQLLLTIDPEPYEIALKRAEANVALAKQARAAAQAAVSAARAQVAERAAEHQDARHNNARLQKLLKGNSVARAKADSAAYRLRETQAALRVAQSMHQQAVRDLDAAEARIHVAEATRAEARLKLSHTRIIASASGVLGQIRVRPGDVVAAGQRLFPLVQDKEVWVDANYKETDLHRIRIGQPATVVVDMYPGRTFHGRVESLSPASGAAFALLPPENATGNWVKVTQRFPVRVLITDPDPSMPLRIGASSTVTIDTVGPAARNTPALAEWSASRER